MDESTLELKIVVPEQMMIDENVDKIIAEAPNGFFCLKPRHIDFTTALIPGVFYYYRKEAEYVVAVDEGTLVKCGLQVMVSVRNAIAGKELSYLEEQVREKFLARNKTEEAAHLALVNMEADIIRRFMELEKLEFAD